MFEHLDDQQPFTADDEFHRAVVTRGRLLRRRRRVGQAAGTCVTALALGGGLVVTRQNPHVTTRIVDGAELDPSRPAATAAAPTAVPDSTAKAPAAAGQAVNVLIVGSDSRACIDPDSPYAGAFGNAAEIGGERGDTIMLARIDPAARTFDLLSFPRDLWLPMDGRAGKSRLSTAFDAHEPSRLINTIANNFFLQIDHYVAIDFCAFAQIVDLVGGVSIPFETAVRDKNTGLFIAEPGCHEFGGDEALAYVRSRRYQTLDPVSGEWQSDPRSDLGRIERQQEFVKRAVLTALTRAADDRLIAKDLIDIAIASVVTDSELTTGDLIDWSRAIGSEAIAGARTFQIEAVDHNVNGQSVLKPVFDSAYMTEVLGIFQGQQAADSVVATDENAINPATTVKELTPRVACSIV